MNDSAPTQIIKCSKCGANNRVATDNQKQPVCGHCKTPLSNVQTRPFIITDSNYSEIVEKSSVPVLLDLWADWCQPCHMIAPIIENLAEELSGRVLVGKLNVDQNKSTAARFNVRGIPTLIILVYGHEVERLVGVQTKAAILQRLQMIIAG